MHAKDDLSTAVVDVNHEKSICIQYESLLPDAPLIVGLHYLPAVIPQNQKGSWYLTGGQEAQLTQVIRQGHYNSAAHTASLPTLTP